MNIIEHIASNFYGGQLRADQAEDRAAVQSAGVLLPQTPQKLSIQKIFLTTAECPGSVANFNLFRSLQGYFNSQSFHKQYKHET